MQNYELNTISVNDVIHTLKKCDGNARYSGMFEHMLAFASELTGISEDTLQSSMYEKSDADPWTELYKKYSKDRGEMSEDEEKRFIDECYVLYEQEGFSSVFWTTWSDQKSRIGQSFEVVERCTPENRDLCTLPMWKIRFPDGTVVQAYPEEIIPSEMRRNGCMWEMKSSLAELIHIAKSQGAVMESLPAARSNAADMDSSEKIP